MLTPFCPWLLTGIAHRLGDAIRFPKLIRYRFCLDHPAKRCLSDLIWRDLWTGANLELLRSNLWYLWLEPFRPTCLESPTQHHLADNYGFIMPSFLVLMALGAQTVGFQSSLMFRSQMFYHQLKWHHHCATSAGWGRSQRKRQTVIKETEKTIIFCWVMQTSFFIRWMLTCWHQNHGGNMLAVSDIEERQKHILLVQLLQSSGPFGRFFHIPS